jgi:hypothetical protein
MSHTRDDHVVITAGAYMSYKPRQGYEGYTGNFTENMFVLERFVCAPTRESPAGSPVPWGAGLLPEHMGKRGLGYGAHGDCILRIDTELMEDHYVQYSTNPRSGN